MSGEQGNVASGKEVFYDVNVNSLAGNSAVHYIYPPTDLYEQHGEVLDPYVSVPDDRVVNVDIAFLRLDNFKDSTQDSTWEDGESHNTNIGGAFWAAHEDDYYYKYTGGGEITAPNLLRGAVNPKIGEAIKLPLDSVGATFENKSLGMATLNVNRFDDLEVEGLNEGTKPTSMQATVIRLEGQDIEDVTYRCFDDTAVPTPVPIANANAITAQANLTHFDGIRTEFVDEETNQFVHQNDDYATADDYVSAVEIVNVERSVDDLRYGDAEDDFPYIFTGASHYFTGDKDTPATQLYKVRNKQELEIDNITVFGGDCFIGLHTFKITDSTYSLTDPEKLITGLGTKFTASDQISKWDYWFEKTAPEVSGEDVSRPYPLKGVSQTITVLLESEVNPEMVEKIPHNSYSYNSASDTGIANLPVPVTDSAGQIRSNFKYRFNLDYARQNSYKVFFPYKTYEKNVNLFGARMMYSDQKIYNSDIEGFDRFRVLNFYDLDETNGSITKLQEAGDRIYAIQENAFSYVPITAQVIESADGSNMTIRSGEVIGIPVKINTLYGSQHPKTVKADSGFIFYVDQLRGEPCLFTGKEVKLISREGTESFFSSALSAISTDSDLSAIYDNKKKEYIVYFRKTDSMVFNASGGIFTARYPEATSVSTLGGVRVGDTMMVAGIGTSTDLSIANLYKSTADIGKWWGTAYTPYVKFVVNQNPDVVKTFDGYTIIVTDEPDPQTFDTFLNDGNIGRSDLTDSTLQYREGTYRDKTLRITENSTDGGLNFSADSDNKRARGTHGEFTINLHATIQTSLSAVLTKYRPSHRAI